MALGQSYLGALGVAEEAAYGTAKAASTWLEIQSESIKSERPEAVSAAITQSRSQPMSVPGLTKVGGGLSIEATGSNLGWLLKWALGSVSSAAVPGSITAVPTGTPAAGGSLVAGNYFYKVAAVLQRTADNRCFVTVPKATAQVTTAGGNLTVNLAWVLAAVPTGFTGLGTLILRTAVGGAVETAKVLDFVPGATEIYSDDGSVSLSTTSPPSDVYCHTYSIGNALRSFTIERVLDVLSGPTAKSAQVIGAKINSMSLNIEPGAALKADFDLVAKDDALIDGTTPSFSLVDPFMGYAWDMYLQHSGSADAASTLMEKLQLQLANGLDPIYSLGGDDTLRRIREGKAAISGSFDVAFENQDEYDHFLQKQDMALRVVAEGYGTSSFTYDAIYNKVAGKHESGLNPALDLSATETYKFKIQVDDDVGGPQTVTLVKANCDNGANTAAEMQTQIQALGGVYAAVTATYNGAPVTDFYRITSGTTGSDSKVRITAADDHDATVVLKLGTANGGSDTDGTQDEDTFEAWPYQLDIDLPLIKYNSAAANLNGANRMVQNVPFVVLSEPSEGYDIKAYLYNTATGYPDAT